MPTKATHTCLPSLQLYIYNIPSRLWTLKDKCLLSNLSNCQIDRVTAVHTHKIGRAHV